MRLSIAFAAMFAVVLGTTAYGQNNNASSAGQDATQQGRRAARGRAECPKSCR